MVYRKTKQGTLSNDDKFFHGVGLQNSGVEVKGGEYSGNEGVNLK